MNEINNVNKFIFIDPNDNWIHLKDFKKEIHTAFKNKNNEKQECILNCLKVYSKLLFIYIENKRKIILFPDNNIHYIFNSYNENIIWKTFDLPMYQFCFSNINKKIEYDNIIKYNFDLERHMKNIISLIINNLDIVSSLIKNNDINKEYIEQILINLPTAYFLRKECKTIIEKCIYLSEKLNLNNSKNRLLLFLYSLYNNPEIIKRINYNYKSNNNNELKVEEEFLKALKENNILIFDNLINTNKQISTPFTDIGETNINNEKKLKNIYAYYENGGLYYNKYKKDKKKSYLDDAKKYLIEAKKLSIEINNYFLIDRINIDLFSIMKTINEIHSLENDNDKNNTIDDNILEYLKSYKLLDEVKFQKPYNNKKLQSNVKNEANNLILEFKENLSPDIVILNSNPLTNNFSVLTNGIFAYLNNQYYLLEKLYEKIKLKIKIESFILNENNLKKAFDKKGKILIIQSDDYSENGEIVLESENGESLILPNKNLEDMLKEKKLKYKVVILCFINSEKIKKIFEDKVQYLITFDNIDCFELDSNTLLQYNQLSIDFLINFIEKTTVLSELEEKIENNIEDSFEKSKQYFIDGLKDYKKIKTFINLNHKNKLTTSIKYKKNKTNGKVVLNNPLLNLPINLPRCKDYTDEIFELIKMIISGKEKFINVYLNNDSRCFEHNSKKINKKTIIGIELMKFFHRHQTFGKLYYIFNPQKYIASLSEILYNVLETSKPIESLRSSAKEIVNDIIKTQTLSTNINKKLSIFILINYIGNKYPFPAQSIKLLNNVQYLIISNKEIIVDSNKDNYEIEHNFHNKYKNRIMINDIDFNIYKYCLIEPKKSKKTGSKDKNNKKNNKLEKENGMFKHFKSIFDYSFESDNTSNYLSSSSNDDLSNDN